MRELKTRKEISDWLTQQLHSIPGCSDTSVSVQYELLEPEQDGCNWSRDLVINYGRDDSEIVLRHLRPLYEDARRRFNVREP
jgi:hypothetical protein